jgi:hypothetical protein
MHVYARLCTSMHVYTCFLTVSAFLTRVWECESRGALFGSALEHPPRPTPLASPIHKIEL